MRPTHPTTALILMHTDSLDSLNFASRSMAKELSLRLQQAVHDHVGPVIVVRQG